MSNNYINIAFMNIHGQTGLDESKQVQIENFIKSYKIDILLKTNMELVVLFPTTLIFKMLNWTQMAELLRLILKTSHFAMCIFHLGLIQQ